MGLDFHLGISHNPTFTGLAQRPNNSQITMATKLKTIGFVETSFGKSEIMKEIPQPKD